MRIRHGSALLVAFAFVLAAGEPRADLARVPPGERAPIATRVQDAWDCAGAT